MLMITDMAETTSWNPESYAKNARFVADLGEPLLQLLDAKPGEMILDLACGDGALTEKIVSAGGKVVGVDSSLAQLHAARSRGLDVALMDGQHLTIHQEFDAVFTNAALHWMKQADKVVDGVASALKPGGRFVGEFGGQGNVETIRQALHSALRQRGVDPWSIDPWYYASAEEYSQLLNRYGFTVDHIELQALTPGRVLRVTLMVRISAEGVHRPGQGKVGTTGFAHPAGSSPGEYGPLECMELGLQLPLHGGTLVVGQQLRARG